MNPLPPQRALPSVDTLLQRLRPTRLPRVFVVAEIRATLEHWRAAATTPIPPPEQLLREIESRVQHLERQRLQPVLNGTGILAHTNLGRAPLPAQAVEALRETAGGYCNLELDLATGQRGARAAHVERALAQLCHAEAAAIVNNGAAALILILRSLIRDERPEVLLSRGELVQIGGGFRIPEILTTVGAVLREVGTTNQTSLPDYAAAFSPRTALVLKVHRSNFHMEGFVDSPSSAVLATLAHQHHVPLVEDLGSGALTDLETLHPDLHHEPTPTEVLRGGADLVCFSGDKLFGGPQAGIIAGSADRVQAARSHPLYRALRCDKLVLAALQATAELHLAHPHGDAEVPMLRLLAEHTPLLTARAESLATRLTQSCPGLACEIVSTRAAVGGGVCPKSSVPSVALRLRTPGVSVEAWAHRLRTGTPPVVGYVRQDAFHLDLRTLFPHQDDTLLAALEIAWKGIALAAAPAAP
ncbi:MAG: L-seryl-tRNA(Sec) selenium transferase [Verrucomicrobiales bacterium]|nr:L-seryl-tRNA(Sec) selenium transferase [Verrucomicrobiales bacterium]